jgi:RNA polymerase sigma factor (sigma-70 family)
VDQSLLQPTDSLLIPFLQEADAKEAERLLAELLTQHAAPVIKNVIAANIGRRPQKAPSIQGSMDADEIEDLMSEVNLKILDRLRYLKLGSNQKPIGSFQGYVATTSYNMCHTYLRRKYPQRSRLKYKLRYILTHRRDLALWEDDQKNWVCGYSAWRDQQRLPVRKGWINELRNNPASAESLRSGAPTESVELLGLIFDLSKAPVEIDDLVTLVAETWQIKDLPAEDADPEGANSIPSDQAAPMADPIVELDQRMYLERVWLEIRELPPAQRSALLLNLTDPQGNTLLVLLSELRIATISEIAEALVLPAEDFASLWKDLPLDDNTIAKRLGVTRQQVTSYRLSARRRLARRMKASRTT